jgi:DNA-binding MurR/RpiR family transcriptional regulator
LQQLFQLELTGSPLHFYSEQASNLVRPSDPQETDLPSRLGQQECGNIFSMIENIDRASFNRAAELIATAPQVRIYGVEPQKSPAITASKSLH